MPPLLYKSDFDEARDRLTTWWNGGDIGRPAMLLNTPRAEPLEKITRMPRPEGWSTHYSTASFEYRVDIARRWCNSTHYLAEAIPAVSPDLGPGTLALYLGCRAEDGDGTVWIHSCIDDPDQARFELNPNNSNWQFTLRLTHEQLKIGKGKWLSSFPDLIEGLDTLASMRGTEKLLMDLIERPQWVHESLQKITQSYFQVYDTLYDLMKDERGGSYFWAWAPGRFTKLQCDISAMISPEMFGEFMVPVLHEMTERLDYSIYHWDGPGALPHHDHLLSIPGITAIQWTPGEAAPPLTDPQWYPYYHKTVEAGKKMMLLNMKGMEHLRALRKEFGRKLNHFIIGFKAESPEQADEILEIVSD